MLHIFYILEKNLISLYFVIRFLFSFFLRKAYTILELSIF